MSVCLCDCLWLPVFLWWASDLLLNHLLLLLIFLSYYAHIWLDSINMGRLGYAVQPLASLDTRKSSTAASTGAKVLDALYSSLLLLISSLFFSITCCLFLLFRNLFFFLVAFVSCWDLYTATIAATTTSTSSLTWPDMTRLDVIWHHITWYDMTRHDTKWLGISCPVVKREFCSIEQNRLRMGRVIGRHVDKWHRQERQRSTQRKCAHLLWLKFRQKRGQTNLLTRKRTKRLTHIHSHTHTHTHTNIGRQTGR